MLLENENIKLRALEPEDLDILYKWENNTQLWIHGNTLAPYPKLALREYIATTQMADIYEAKQLRLMIECKQTKAVIGTIDMYDCDFHHRKAGIGILIEEAFRKQDFATMTLNLISKYAFEFLRLNQLYAYIAEDNTQSLKLFEKVGYQNSSILKEWIFCESQYKDVYIYQLINTSK